MIDYMSVSAFFQYMFNNFVALLSMPIPLGGNVSITIFGVFIGIVLLGLVLTVVRKLYD